MLKTFKKLFVKKKKKEDKEQKFVNSVKNSSSKIVNLLSLEFQDFCRELKIMKQKSKNLFETNMNLGLKKIENGDISEAIFRFKFTSIVWSDKPEPKYYLAYCYILKKKYSQAQKILRKNLENQPDHLPSQDLLLKIENRR